MARVRRPAREGAASERLKNRKLGEPFLVVKHMLVQGTAPIEEWVPLYSDVHAAVAAIDAALPSETERAKKSAHWPVWLSFWERAFRVRRNSVAPPSPFVFRGHSRGHHSLTPTIFRALPPDRVGLDAELFRRAGQEDMFRREILSFWPW